MDDEARAEAIKALKHAITSQRVTLRRATKASPEYRTKSESRLEALERAVDSLQVETMTERVGE